MNRAIADLLHAAILVVWLASVTPSYAQGVLENDRVRLKLEDGRITSLFDKHRQAEHIFSGSGPLSDFLAIELVRAGGTESVIKASEMKSRVIREGPDRIEIRYTHPKAEATVRVAIDARTGESRWTVKARPVDRSLAVGSVSCPIVDTPQSEGGVVKKYLLPFYEGVFAPLTARHRQGFAYPKVLFAQLIACIGPKAGVMFWTDDEKVHVKEFAFENRKPGKSVFRVTHRFPYVDAREWVQPYQTRLSLVGPAWHDAADIYRDWVTSGSMLGKKLRERKHDAAASLVHKAPVSIQTALPVVSAEAGGIPGKIADWQKIVDASFVLRGTQWEKQWPWHSGPDFFPPRIGEQAFRNLAKELSARNVTLVNDVHGLIWAAGNHRFLRNFRKTTEDEIVRIARELAEYFVEHGGKDVCITQRDGSLSGADNRYRICRGTEFGRTYLLRNAEKLFDLGATGFHSDLDTGPLPDGVEGCFNTAHGHPIPCGTWSYEAARQNFVDIRALAARRGVKPFLLTKEHCTESLIPVLDAYLGRHSSTLEDPRVCHLAQYLFHEYIPTMLEGSGSFQKLAAQVVYGQLPGIPLLPPRELAYLPLLQDYCRAMKGDGKDFLLYGRMLRPVIQGIPTTRGKMKPKQYVDFTNPDGKRETASMAIPAVLHAAWEDGEGNIGIFAVNTQDAAIDLHLPVQGIGPSEVIFREGQQPAKRQRAEQGAVLSWRVPSRKLCSVIFRRTRRGAISARRLQVLQPSGKTFGPAETHTLVKGNSRGAGRPRQHY